MFARNLSGPSAPFVCSDCSIIIYESDMYVIDVNSAAGAEKTITLYDSGVTNRTPDICAFTITHTISNPEMSAYFTWDETDLVLTQSHTSVYSMTTYVTYTATNMAGSIEHTEQIEVRNCIHETKQTSEITEMDDHYVLLNEPITDQLTEAHFTEWLDYCSPYYFGIKIEETHGTSEWYVGGVPT